MSDYILKVPASQDPVEWFAFIKESLEEVDDTTNVIVDFNNVNFLDTDDFVVLACLIESFSSEGSRVSFINGTDKFNSHLSNIKFKQYWDDNFDREMFTVSFNKSTLCLWKISEGMIYSYSMYAKKYFRDTFMNDKDLVPLALNLEEVFNNIFDHSGSPISGYVITQFFPYRNKLSFSVCDFGVGIPTSINQFRIINNKKPIEDWDALNRSVRPGFSVKSNPHNRGMGLDNIISFTEANNGMLRIISNDGYFEKKAGNNYNIGHVDFGFSGTLIKVTIDTNFLNEMDISEEIYDL